MQAVFGELHRRLNQVYVGRIEVAASVDTDLRARAVSRPR